MSVVLTADGARAQNSARQCKVCTRWKKAHDFGVVQWTSKAEPTCRKCLRDERMKRLEPLKQMLISQPGPPLPEGVALHQCSWCKKSKPASEFNRDRSSRSGLQAYCRACHKARRNAVVKHERKRTDATFGVASSMITCGWCGLAKLPTEYNTSSSARTGRQSYCRDCAKIIGRLRNRFPHVGVAFLRSRYKGVTIDQLPSMAGKRARGVPPRGQHEHNATPSSPVPSEAELAPRKSEGPKDKNPTHWCVECFRLKEESAFPKQKPWGAPWVCESCAKSTQEQDANKGEAQMSVPSIHQLKAETTSEYTRETHGYWSHTHSSIRDVDSVPFTRWLGDGHSLPSVFASEKFCVIQLGERFFLLAPDTDIPQIEMGEQMVTFLVGHFFGPVEPHGWAY